MQGSTVKGALLAFAIATVVPVAACTSSPTSPTQSGPGVIGSPFAISGVINKLDRSGPDGLNVVFRIGDEPLIRGDANTTVLDGSVTGNTSYLRHGYRVTVDGRVTADGVYARHVIIDFK
jgi:hypothetical protein